MQTHPKLSLIEHFKELPDPRVQGRCDHDLIDVLVADAAAVECLCQEIQESHDEFPLCVAVARDQVVDDQQQDGADHRGDEARGMPFGVEPEGLS